ncbi:FUSC family protein [Pseudoxanthomonas dokdonensis]|uniref:Fusaric acid resistance protein n=1 Tax=Pseudoxanthomonas dokdonensis TaxID=344882 RepID=A0A0R0CV02_9GAMM|nr:FUSC family protein [Pseudoxanthomonas dokdonensis]KRG68776.1 hypothetical protein ABB29_09760 [Pseudoxanthomonas dokdonensis]
MQGNLSIPSTAPAWRTALSGFAREESDAWRFVLKAALAFFIAGWLAMRLKLPSPGTAMLTTVIVMHRQSGMVLAKAFYRSLGTLAGALAALLIVGLFAQQRVLSLGALGLWVGLCAGGAVFHRNFKSYAFVLAGYTAAIIALPVASHPQGIFDSAIARITEVMLGLLVSAVISDCIFPVRLRDSLRATARAQYQHFIDFVRRTTAGQLPREDMERAHLRFVRDVVTLEDLRSSVVFEDADARARSEQMQRANHDFMAVSTTFQSLHHLLNRLQRRQAHELASALAELYRPLSDDLACLSADNADDDVCQQRLQATAAAMDARAATLRKALPAAASLDDFDAGALLVSRFASELATYVHAHHALRQRQRIAVGPAPERVRFQRGHDHVAAALAVLRTTLTMWVLASFWIASAWPSGAGMMLLATIFSGLFATAPNPTGILGRIAVGYLIGMSMGFVCEFFVLTRMDGFALMVAGILPFFIIGPYLTTRPAWAVHGLGYTMGFAYILGLNNPMVFSPLGFVNDGVAQMVGVGAVLLAFVLVPSLLGSGHWRRRQMAALRQQVRMAVREPLAGLLQRFESGHRDLFQQVVSHTAPGSDDSRALLSWALSVHESGRAVIELRQGMASDGLPAEHVEAVEAVMATLAALYAQPDAERYRICAHAHDAAIALLAAVPAASTGQRRALSQLRLMRLALADDESPLAPYIACFNREVAHAA